jgi:hypothetical protein
MTLSPTAGTAEANDDRCMGRSLCSFGEPNHAAHLKTVFAGYPGTGRPFLRFLALHYVLYTQIMPCTAKESSKNDENQTRIAMVGIA